MDRRAFLLTAGVLTSPVGLGAQHAARPHRVVELNPLPPAPGRVRPALHDRLREFGYTQGQNILVEYRFAGASEDRLREYAAQAVRENVSVILAVSSSAVRAATKATSTLPIVGLDLETDPIASGAIASLARPGGNLTGVFLDLPELAGKRLELLREAVPGIARVAVLWDPTMATAPLVATEAAARRLGLTLQVVKATEPRSLDQAFRAAVNARSRALMVIQSPMLDAQERLLVELAGKHRLPTTSIFSHTTEGGLLMSYGPNLDHLFRQAAGYVDRILKGAAPGDLPIERPAKFELAINLHAARALGLKLPASLLQRADRIIE